MLFRRHPPLQAPEGEAGGGAGASLKPGKLDPAVEAGVNEMLNSWSARFLKTELPKALSTALSGFSSTLTNQFLESLAQQLPSDEEIEAAEAAEAAAGAAGEGGDPAAAGKAGAPGSSPMSPEFRAQLLKLQKQNTELQTRIETMEQESEEAWAQAEFADRQGAIQGAINKFPFANDASRQVVFNHLLSQVERGEEGELIAGGLPLAEFVEQQMGGLAGLLNAKPVGGSGANNAGAGGRGPAVPTLEQITPETDPKTLAAIKQHAVAQLTGGTPGARV